MILFRPIHVALFLGATLVVIYFTIPSNRDLGLYYFNSYEYEKAVSYLLDGESLHSNDVFVLKKLKDYSLIQGNVAKAYQTQLKLVSLRPKNKEYLLEAEKLAAWSEKIDDRLSLKEKRALLELEENVSIGQQLLLEVAQGFRYIKDFENADRVYNEVSTFDSKYFKEETIRYFLARKNATRAEELLRSYSELYPDDDELGYFFYQTLIFQDKYHEAVIALLKDIFPQVNFKTLDITLIKRSLQALQSSELKQKRGKLEKVLSGLYYSLRKGEEVNFSENDFLELVDAYNARFFGLSRFLVELVRKEKGDTDFSLALTEKARVAADQGNTQDFRETHYELANLLIDRKNYSQALMDLEKLTKRFPLNRRYWQMIAEVYDLLGKKQKSIRAYFKLYQLQKNKVDQSYVRKIPLRYLFAQVSEIKNKYQGGSFAMPRFRPSAKDYEIKRLLSVEDRLIGAIYSLEDPQEKLQAFEKLLKESPLSLNAMKGKAYTLYELERPEEAMAIFKRIYQKKTNDPDANRALVNDWIQEKNWSRVESATKVLRDNYQQTEVDEILRDFYFAKDKTRYREFCANTTDKGAQIDCLYRLETPSKSLAYVRRLTEASSENCEYFVRRLYLETEVGELEWAIDKIKDQQRSRECMSSKTRNEIEDFIYSQNQLRSSGQFWRYEQSFGLLETEQFDLGDVRFALMRKLKTWALSFEGQHDRILSGGDANFNFANIGFTKFFKNRSAFTVGPTFTFGDKDAKPGFFARYMINLSNVFFSGEAFSYKPLRFTRDLAQEPSTYGTGVELYTNYRSTNRIYNLIGYANLQNVHYRGQSSFFSQITGEGLIRIYHDQKRKPLELMTGAQVSNSNLSDPRPVLRDSFLNKSLALHGVLKLDYNYPENFIPRKWSGFLRLGLGGDFQRNVDFFESIQFTGQVNKAISKRAKVFFSGEYYSEFLGVNRGNTRVYRLGLVQDF